MPFVTFDDWAGGLDVRPASQLSKPNIVRLLMDAYISTGKSIKKRPCLQSVATLEAGTKGLRAFGGKLNTFYGSSGAQIVHANPLFRANRVAIAGHTAMSKIHYCDQYDGLMYCAIEYLPGVIRHHYLDDPGAWAPGTAYTINTIRRPVTSNGFRFQVVGVAGTGTSGAVEPVWPTTIGGTVIDNPGPNQLQWSCIGFEITDTNCPQTKQVAKQSQKIFAAGVAGDTVRFCKTGAPRDWTTASDAGFLAVGRYAQGSSNVTALAPFKKKSLGVFFSDNLQVWFTDPDPAQMDLTDSIGSIGTNFSRAAAAVQQDTFFHAQNGFRSLAFSSTVSDNVQDSDIGSPIDTLVVAATLDTDDPLALYYPKLGQFWEINGSTVWSYSFSRTSKLTAWSKFRLPFTIDDATVLNQELYLRSGDDVYKASTAVFKDGVSSIPAVEILMYPQDGKVPGVLKQFYGMDTMGTGRPTISVKYFDEDGVERETQPLEYPAMTEQGPMYPVEILSTRIAPHIAHQKDEAFEIAHLSFLYEKLGAM